ATGTGTGGAKSGLVSSTPIVTLGHGLAVQACVVHSPSVQYAPWHDSALCAAQGGPCQPTQSGMDTRESGTVKREAGTERERERAAQSTGRDVRCVKSMSPVPSRPVSVCMDMDTEGEGEGNIPSRIAVSLPLPGKGREERGSGDVLLLPMARLLDGTGGYQSLFKSAEAKAGDAISTLQPPPTPPSSDPLSLGSVSDSPYDSVSLGSVSDANLPGLSRPTQHIAARLCLSKGGAKGERGGDGDTLWVVAKSDTATCLHTVQGRNTYLYAYTSGLFAHRGVPRGIKCTLYRDCDPTVPAPSDTCTDTVVGTDGGKHPGVVVCRMALPAACRVSVRAVPRPVSSGLSFAAMMASNQPKVVQRDVAPESLPSCTISIPSVGGMVLQCSVEADRVEKTERERDDSKASVGVVGTGLACALGGCIPTDNEVVPAPVETEGTPNDVDMDTQQEGETGREREREIPATDRVTVPLQTTSDLAEIGDEMGLDPEGVARVHGAPAPPKNSGLFYGRTLAVPQVTILHGCREGVPYPGVYQPPAKREPSSSTPSAPSVQSLAAMIQGANTRLMCTRGILRGGVKYE
ncbi:hypothetical protein KIPB_008965, partial [Kipferlia bialata]